MDETGSTEGSVSTEESTSVITSRRWSAQNWMVIMLFSLLTILGIAISTGMLGLNVIQIPDPDTTTSIQIPLYVYLYATLGALGYVFTRLMNRLENYDEWGEIEKLAEMGLRIPAAWVLSAGIYLLLSEFTTAGSSASARTIAGIAFLVGLYVNVALKSLGSIADRILGRPRNQ
ncbi:MAG: hypothetical protein SVG88_09000 [Halobacteriales archaeon]|nr:hypothetical protein [Halobacteriales archaeon]